MRDDRSRLQDIIRALDEIKSETLHAKEVFAQDRRLQVWGLYHLQVVGTDDFRERNPDPVWSKAIVSEIFSSIITST